MDLKKIYLYEENYSRMISDEDIARMENKKIIYGGYFYDSKCGFDFLNLTSDDKVKLYIGNYTEDDDRIFLKCSIIFSNGQKFEESAWSYNIIPLLSMNEIKALPMPRRLSIKLEIGIYSGTGGTKLKWQNIFTDPKDFMPVCSPPTFHSKCMNDLKISGMFSDVTLLCDNMTSICTHKCILVGSPYFRALFGCHFAQKDQKVVRAESDAQTMLIVLTFLYTEQITEEEVTNWPKLFQVASFYQIETLTRHCELQMMTRVTNCLEDIKELLKFAIKLHANKLKRYLVVLTRRIQETA